MLSTGLATEMPVAIAPRFMLRSQIDRLAEMGHPVESSNVYAARDLPRVPHTLEQAIANFKTSAVARATFGDAVVDHYAHFYEMEMASFNQSVTDWERARYFDRI